MKTVNLTMIVKDEATNIQRCLDSVKSYVDHWTICDTGSTDGTQGIIKKQLSGIPGEIHEVPWVSFAHNRSEALEFSRGKADYHLFVDADNVVNVKDEFRNDLELDSYLLGHEGDLDYYHECLLSDRHKWYFVGALHEYVHTDSPRVRAILPKISLKELHDGCRTKQGNKFKKDVEILLAEHEKDPNNARTVFYLAQSYRDLGDSQASIEWYQKRVAMGGWAEEVWYSLYQIPQLESRLGVEWPAVMELFLQAYNFRPSRLEPLFHVARHYRVSRQFYLGWLFSRVLLITPYPKDTLFIERNIYEWELPTEYVVCAYHSGEHAKARWMNEQIINRSNTPESFRKLAVNNADKML